MQVRLRRVCLSCRVVRMDVEASRKLSLAGQAYAKLLISLPRLEKLSRGAHGYCVADSGRCGIQNGQERASMGILFAVTAHRKLIDGNLSLVARNSGSSLSAAAAHPGLDATVFAILRASRPQLLPSAIRKRRLPNAEQKDEPKGEERAPNVQRALRCQNGRRVF
eukprot:scaffold536_cov250-Pinguiococcus_pyrenoidosus.AAC.13